METLLPRIWVFVLAFGLGISISAIWRIYTLPALPEPVIEPVAEPVPVIEFPKEEGLRIVGGTHVCGASADPAVYDLSDGTRISVNCKKFKSLTALDRELQRRLDGVKVEEWTMEIDSNGESQRRAILYTSPTLTRLRVNGRLLCITAASSLEHIRWFEGR